MAHIARQRSVDVLLNEQSRIIASWQLEAAGVTASAIRARLRAERWQRCSRGVFAAFSGELSWLQRVWAAILACGPTAAATSDTALRLFGIQPATDVGPCIRINVEHHRQVSPPDGVRVTRRRQGTCWVHPTLLPPRVRLEHAALEWASEQRNDADLIAVLADVVQQRRTTPARLRDALARRQRLPHRTLLRQVLDDVGSGAYSLLEVRYLRNVERMHRLPPGRRRVATQAGRRYYRDVAYDDFRTLVELDGRLGHELAGDRWADMDRDNLAAASGLITLRLGFGQVVGTPCRTAQLVGRVLAARGWRDKPLQCGPSCHIG